VEARHLASLGASGSDRATLLPSEVRRSPGRHGTRAAQGVDDGGL